MSKPTLDVEDNTDEIMKVINSFKRDNVLIGIPDDGAERKDGDPINNAALLFINNFGCEEAGIPPRPVMEIGIRAVQVRIADTYIAAVKAAFIKGVSSLNTYYQMVGMLASNSVKNVINNQIDIEGPAAATLKSRESKGFGGKKSLVVTGQMRNAITYVVPGPG